MSCKIAINMISILDFEKQLKGQSLNRGKDYFEANAVTAIEEVQAGVWVAEVEGTADYEVSVSLTKTNTVKDCFCDCPHDAEFCKHVIAVLYSIRDQKNITIEAPKIKKMGFSQLLKKVNQQELTDFVKKHATKDKNFKVAFEMAFAEKDENFDLVNAYDGILTKVFRTHTQRGFVHYQNAKPLARELTKILNEVRTLLAGGNLRDAFNINKLVLRETVYSMTDADDSAGYLGGVVEESIEVLEHIFEQCAIDLKEEIFNFMDTQLRDKIYFESGDVGNHLFEVYFSAAIALSKSDCFFAYVDQKIASLTGRYDDYLRSYLQKRKIEFLKQTGSTKEAEKLVLQNLDIVDVRAAEVEKLIKAKAYEKAKEMLVEGIKVAEKKGHSGTVGQWQQQLLNIAVAEDDTATIRKFAKLFAFGRVFQPQFYKQWKNTYNAGEWGAVIEEHILKTIKSAEEEAKKHRFFHNENIIFLRSLAPIYIAEGFIDRLWLQIKKGFDLDTLLNYHEHIFTAYADELLGLYLRALDKEAERATDRNAYHSVVYQMTKIAGNSKSYREAIQQKTKMFKQLYAKRPAFLEELSAI